MRFELARWARIALVFGVVVLAAAAGIGLYRWSIAPVTLTVAAGSMDGEAPRLMSAIASRLPTSNTRIRLKVIEKESTLAATTAFSKEEVDLAVVRSDVGELSAARAVVRLAHGVALIAALPGAPIKSVDELKGKTVGIVGGEINRNLAQAIDKAYDLTAGKTRFVDVAYTDAPKVVQSKQVQALLFVVPVTEKYLGMVRDLFPRSGKQSFHLLAIESAGAIASIHNSYESYEVPKGAIRGSPAVPDEDMTTVRVPFHLVANRKIEDDRITELAKAVMDVKRDLVGDFPLLAQFAGPSTERDAPIPIHPGAKTFFEGEEKTFLERHGDLLFYGMMVLGSLTSVVAGAWKFMGFGAPPVQPQSIFHDLLARVRSAKTEDDLQNIEQAIDRILTEELDKHTQGKPETADTTLLALTAHRLEYLINSRRATLGTQAATSPASSA